MSAIVNPEAQRPRRAGRLFVELAASPEEVRESQSLRYRIFAEELGARLGSAESGIDRDRYDDYCHHLLVRELDTGRVVASTRLLSGDRADEAGGFYSESEFDLENIRRLGTQGSRLLEIGRTCVDPAFRSGSAIAVLWSGLAGYIKLHGCDYLFGCASIDLGENAVAAAVIVNRLRERALSTPQLRVVPRLPADLPIVADGTVTAPMPPLLKAYVRLGARACGEPCLDPDFGVADVLMLLDMRDLSRSYERHFGLKEA